MLERKFATYIENFLQNERNKILLVNGARQIGKSFIIRHVGQILYKHFVEINLKEDLEGERIFSTVKSTKDLYMVLSNFYNKPLGDNNDTLIFFFFFQSYPNLLNLL